MSIDLDQETQLIIEAEVRAGSFHDAATLVGTAVRHLLVTRKNLNHSRDEIDQMLAQAIGSLERGEGVDGETFFDELEISERGL